MDVALHNTHLSALDNSKMTSQTHKYLSFLQNYYKKMHVYIDIRWTWNWNQYFYLGIWVDDRTNMIVLPSFHPGTRLNSQNTNDIEFNKEFWNINFFLILVIPIGVIKVSTTRKWVFEFISVLYAITDL